jgi:ferric enterobactin receptor
MWQKIAILPFLLLLTLFSIAQTHLTGLVKDNGTKLPLAGAGVILTVTVDSSHNHKTITDTLGRFSFPVPAPGQYTLTVSYIGYSEKTHSFQVVDGKSFTIDDILLEPVSNNLTEIVLRAPLRTITTKEGNAVIRVADNKELATAVNLLDVLRRTPGVSVDGENLLQVANGVSPVIFVGGRPLLLSNQEQINYLKSLTTDKVLSIELITNPSARYDGEYKAIIDIKLQRDKTQGWAANYNGLLEQNQVTNSDQTINLSYKQQKLAYYTTVGYTRGKTIYRYGAYQHLANTDILKTQLEQKALSNSYNMQLGVDYNPDAKQKMGVLFRHYRPDLKRERMGSLLSTDKTGNNIVFDNKSDNPIHFRQYNTALTVDYSLQSGNWQFNLLGNLLAVTNKQNDDFINSDHLANAPIGHWQSDLSNKIRIYTAQADISRKIKEWKIDGGLKYSHSATNNNLRYDTLNKQNTWVYDADRSNIFLYTEKIGAAYITGSGKIGVLQVNAGIRAEQTNSISNSITLDSLIKNRYTKWLPSFSVAYAMDKNQELSFSYASKLTRPGFSQLNPFRFYFSTLNYWIGNPYLLPANTNQFRLTYRYKKILVESNIGRENNVLARYPIYDSVTNELAYLGRNWPRRQFANLLISFPVKIKSWWDLSYQINGYYNKQKTPYLDKVYDLNVYSYISRLNQTFILPRQVTVNLLFNYESRTGNSLYIIKPMYNIDIGIQKLWFGRLNTKLSINDIFNTYHQYLIFRYKEILNNELSHWWGIRKLQLNISYNLGK